MPFVKRNEVYVPVLETSLKMQNSLFLFFFFFHSLKVREKLIADASTDLLAGKITPREFVSRVAYRSKPLVMTDMDSVNENKDELIFDLMKDAENVDEGEGAGAHAVNQASCVICTTSTELTVLFTLSRHLILCNDCYLSYVASQVADYNGNLEEDDIPIICPSCRTPHTKRDVISGIFTP